MDTDEAEDVGELYSGPLCNVRPALFAGELGDLVASGVAPELCEGDGCGSVNQAFDRERPIGEATCMKFLELVLGGATWFSTGRSEICERENSRASECRVRRRCPA